MHGGETGRKCRVVAGYLGRFVSAAVFGCALMLAAGCSSPPDAETTRDSLTDVTESPEPEFDSEARKFAEELEVDVLECSRVLVITARGTGEPIVGQLLSPVARAIEDARPDETEVHHLDYPASTEVKDDASVGVITLAKTLNQQAAACPFQRFVLLGYSQGALVIGDALVDPEMRIVGTYAERLSEAARERVAAVVFYGDPRFVGTEPFNRGYFNPDIDGILARSEGALDPYADRLADFCVRADFVCQASMSLNEQGHVEYFDNGMQEEGAEFVLARLIEEDSA